jgi:demethylmenaquinone methyltransferase/2-methoxy-6-polyprenyl-1,4-benzoquinol methylase
MPEPRKGSPSIQTMFSAIAGRYDLLNRLLSFGIDIKWRRELALEMPTEEKGVALDLATGTGNVALTLMKNHGHWKIIGADFAIPMLRIAREKLRTRSVDGLFLTAGDAMSMPFSDSTFNAVTIAFGIRNLPDRTWALAEMNRVMEPGGRLIILEFSRMDRPVIGHAFRLYFHSILPFLGGIISGNPGAYRYLPRSVDDFPDPEGLCNEMRKAGFKDVRNRPLTCGIAYLHVGEKYRQEAKGRRQE